MRICKLYRLEETIVGYPRKFATDICSDPLREFDNILDREFNPFSDEVSLQFMKEACGIEFVDSMHIQNVSHTFAIHNLAEEIKETLMLLKNSQIGKYTVVRYINRYSIIKWIRDFEKFDLLFAYIVDCGETDPVVDHIYPLKIENFMFRGKVVPVILDCEPRQKGSELVYQTGEGFELYRYPDGVYESPFFFSLFEYDWKRDLPNIKDFIDCEYEDYKILDKYEKVCELKDILPVNHPVRDDEAIYNPKVVSHLLYLSKLEADNRRIVVLFVNYLEDGSVSLETSISFKYPDLRGLLENNNGMTDGIRYRFFLYIDVNERISSKKDFGETWIGGYIYEEYLELYNKDDALREFGKMIPDILVKMKLPIDRNYLARG